MPDRPRIIAMLNQKGGVGKTTTTVNLGAALAEAGQRVLLVDLDPQAHLTLHLGLDDDSRRTVYDLLLDPDCTPEEVLILDARPNLDAILAEVGLAAAGQELAGLDGREQILRRRLAPILDPYDVVLVDCPPSLGLLTLNAMALAREIIVPMQAHFLALQGLGKLLDTVRLVVGSVNDDLEVTGVVLCIHERQTTLAREVTADLEAFFEAAREHAVHVPWRRCRVLAPPIRRNIKLAEAPSFGNTIFDYAPTCHGACDYRALAANLLEAWAPRPPEVEETPPPDEDAPTSSEEVSMPTEHAPSEPVLAKPVAEAALEA